MINRASAFIAGIIGAGSAIKRTCADFLCSAVNNLINQLYSKLYSFLALLRD